MKFTVPFFFHLSIALCVLFSAGSCKNAQPDFSKGLKVTLQLSLTQTVASIAIHPSDSGLLAALEQADVTKHSTGAFIDSFMHIYDAAHPGRAAAVLFPINKSVDESSDAATARAKEMILQSINAKRLVMARTITKRIHEFCDVPETAVRVEHHGRLMTVYASGVKNEKDLVKVFSNPMGMRFWEVYTFDEIGQHLIAADKLISDEQRAEYMNVSSKIDTLTEASLLELTADGKSVEDLKSVLFTYLQPAIDTNGVALDASYIGLAPVRDTAKINAMLRLKNVTLLFPSRLKWMWGQLPSRDEKFSNPPVALYAIKQGPLGQPLINAGDIQDAVLHDAGNKIEISIAMNGLGSIKWQRATARNINNPIAMEMGDYVYSAPNVLNEIWGGRSTLTGDFTTEEAEALTAIIKSGDLPIPFKVVRIEPFQKQQQH